MSTVKRTRSRKTRNPAAVAGQGVLRAEQSGWASIRTFVVKYKFFHFLVLPGFLYYLIFHYIPMIGIVTAFTDYHGMGGIRGLLSSPWVGFGNFAELFQSRFFWRVLRNTLVISSLRLLFAFPAPIILSLFLNEVRSSAFRRTVQTITYLPYFLSWVVVSGLLSMFLATQPVGPVNAALASLFGSEPIGFLTSRRYFRGLLVASGIWKTVGWSTIIYLAAISSVPVEQYDAAYVEGANRLQQTWYVTLPWIRPVVVILLILAIGQIIEEDFEQIFNLYNEAVYEVADVFETYLYRKGLGERDFSYATAVGLFKSVVSLIMVVGANQLSKKIGQEGLW